MPEPFRHAFIVGTGLLGASLGLALRRAGAVAAVTGWDRSDAHRHQAQQIGALDRATERLDATGADLVVLATPVGAMPDALRELAPTLGAGAVVTDVGSVKKPVLAAAAAALPGATVFVGGHPLAGKAEAGPQAADAGLFEGARWVLCPGGDDPDTLEATARLAALVTRLGAVPLIREAAAHDRQVAGVSHLPQVASSALALAGAALLAGDPGGGQLAASGWRDTTRLAGSDPEMWRDICLANGPALARALDAYAAALGRFAAAVADQDGAALLALFAEAQAARQEVA